MEFALVSALKETTSETNGLSVECMKSVAADLDIPLSHVAGVATFYSDFIGCRDGEVDMRFAEGEFPFEVAYEQAARMAQAPDVIERLKKSEILGRSGSRFPVAAKWELSALEKSDVKYVVCNCAEGEAGTYKDLKLMCKAPHTIIEGMVLCAGAIGATKGIIFVRSEYTQARKIMEKAVEESRRYLGAFELTVVSGVGCYVCGEETALIRCLEGCRGEPTLKPPYPGVAGLYGKPTVVNNAESFAAAAYLLHGQKFKLYTVSGAVAKPGVYMLPPGTSVRELASLAGADDKGKGFQLGGGTTGAIYGKKDLDISADIGTASVVFFHEFYPVRQHCKDCIEFLADQSCGMCTPCRYGLQELADALNGNSSRSEIMQLCSYIEKNARCAFGQAAPTCVTSALQAFPDDF